MNHNSFYSISRSDLSELLQEAELSASHSKAIFSFVYRQIAEKPSLPSRRISNFLNKWSRELPRIITARKSEFDHSWKLVLELHDQRQIETVIIPEKNRITLCVSSQVGCRQACTFCHTGRMGLLRQLRADEIVAQLMVARMWLTEQGSSETAISNIVFMGMGEPLDNCSEVFQAIKIMTDPAGLAIAPKRITVSTAGHKDGILKLIESNLGVGLALSLHASSEALRRKIMPITKRFPLHEVFSTLEAYSIKTGKPVFYQYTLISGVNDSPEDAHNLVKLLSTKKTAFKVNLIPFNEFSASAFKRPNETKIQSFRKILANANILTIVRYSKGRDIAAACGQLIKTNIAST